MTGRGGADEKRRKHTGVNQPLALTAQSKIPCNQPLALTAQPSLGTRTTDKDAEMPEPLTRRRYQAEAENLIKAQGLEANRRNTLEQKDEKELRGELNMKDQGPKNDLTRLRATSAPAPSLEAKRHKIIDTAGRKQEEPSSSSSKRLRLDPELMALTRLLSRK